MRLQLPSVTRQRTHLTKLANQREAVFNHFKLNLQHSEGDIFEEEDIQYTTDLFNSFSTVSGDLLDLTNEAECPLLAKMQVQWPILIGRHNSDIAANRQSINGALCHCETE